MTQTSHTCYEFITQNRWSSLHQMEITPQLSLQGQKNHCHILKCWQTHHHFYMKEMHHMIYKKRPTYHGFLTSDGKHIITFT